MKFRSLILVAAGLVPIGLIGWGGFTLYKKNPVAAPVTSDIPTTSVKRGDVTFTVTARGELQGGQSEMLTTPMMGGGQLVLTSLRTPGDQVKDGDIVAQFDTTEQEFKLKEAQADLAEAEQQVVQAEADGHAKEIEAEYELVQAKADLRQAELEARRNPLLAAITARQNTLAVEAAKDHLRQLEHDIPSRKANATAGIAIQEAARNKATVQATTAQRNIDSMTLKAHRTGYVSIQQNTNSNFMFTGMQLPFFQLGDSVRPGMAVAQIPDLSNWDVSSRIGELDRGHLAEGQKVNIRVIAVPNQVFTGHVKTLAGTTGPPWDRRFECKIALDKASPEVRPGMSANIEITTETLPNVLSVPAQAVFESDGRSFVYLQTAGSFVPADIKVVRRSESQVVFTGLKEGQLVAMASPDQQNKKTGAGSALQALPK
jgi:HlyD family secretion protein